MAFSLYLSIPIWARKVGNFSPLFRSIPILPFKYIYIYIYIYVLWFFLAVLGLSYGI